MDLINDREKLLLRNALVKELISLSNDNLWMMDRKMDFAWKLHEAGEKDIEKNYFIVVFDLELKRNQALQDEYNVILDKLLYEPETKKINPEPGS